MHSSEMQSYKAFQAFKILLFHAFPRIEKDKCHARPHIRGLAYFQKIFMVIFL